MRLVQHNEIPIDPSLAQEWNDLVAQMERPEVFFTYEWALAVQRSYGLVVTPLLFLAYEENELIGVVALATYAGTEATFFLASSTADYCDFICAPARKMEFVCDVLSELREHSSPKLVFANLPADSTTTRALKAARKRGYFAFVRPAYSCAQVSISEDGQLSDTAHSARRRLVRFQKSLRGKEKISVRHSKTSNEIEKALPDFAITHVGRFLMTGRISNLVHVERRDFLSQLSKLLSPSGSVVLSRLMFGERPAAWNFGFLFNGSWFWYQPTFDTEFQLYSPGVWLLSAIVDQACSTPGIRRVDLGLGAEGYKERLANSSRQTLHITATRSVSAYLREVVRHHAANTVKAMPRIEGLIRSGRKRALSLNSSLRREGISKCCSNAWAQFGRKISETPRFLLFEWEGNDKTGSTTPIATLEAINLNLLGKAAILYERDLETLEYLVGAAKHISTDATGFCLLNDSDIPIYFCWSRNFENQIQSGDDKRGLGKDDNFLIFDYWIPLSARGCKNEESALCAVASQLRLAGKRAWILSDSRDFSFIDQVQRAGFVLRLSANRRHDLVRKIFRVSQSATFVGRTKASHAA